MKYNFGQKQYDVLLGAGPGGAHLYTTVLNSEQKHQLAMMKSTADVHAELKNIRNNAASNVHYVQEMSDIKKYLKVKSAQWAIIAMFCLLILGFIGATVFISDQQPIASEFATWTICIVFGICFYFSFRKASRYHKQMNIMEDL